MKIIVGSTMRFRGVDCICSRITKTTESTFASDSSDVMEAKLAEPVNVVFMPAACKIGKFEEREIIVIESEKLELTAPGKNTWYIYSKLIIHKEGESIDDAERSEDESGEARDPEAQVVGTGVGSGGSVGEKTAG